MRCLTAQMQRQLRYVGFFGKINGFVVLDFENDSRAMRLYLCERIAAQRMRTQRYNNVTELTRRVLVPFVVLFCFRFDSIFTLRAS